MEAVHKQKVWESRQEDTVSVSMAEAEGKESVESLMVAYWRVSGPGC